MSQEGKTCSGKGQAERKVQTSQFICCRQAGSGSMLAGLLLCPFGIWLPLGQGEPSARVRAKHKTSVPALIFAPPVTSRPAPPKHNMRRKTSFHQAQSMREKSCSARKHLTQLSLWAWIAAGTKGAGLEPAKKGLRDRNNPMCTLSQNGYGASL